MSIRLRDPFSNRPLEQLTKNQRSQSSDTTIVHQCRNPERIGPWKIKRAYSEPDNRLHGRKPTFSLLHEERPALKEFLTQVDKSCDQIDELTVEDQLGRRHDNQTTTQLAELDQFSWPAGRALKLHQLKTWAPSTSAIFLFTIIVCACTTIFAPIILTYLLAIHQQGSITVRDGQAAKKLAGTLLTIDIFSVSTLASVAVVCAYLSLRGRRLTLKWLVVILLIASILGAVTTVWTLTIVIPCIKQR